MKVIILAAGEGTRLKKYTLNLPKGMLKFKEKTIIERQIEIFRECGLKDIIIVKGFAEETINYEGIKYYINKKYHETNMVETLMEAEEEFNDDIIVSYSDILFDKELVEKMKNNNAKFSVAVDMNWKEYWQERYGKVDFDTESLKLDNNGNIISLGKENPKLEDIDARYIGLLKFSKEGLEKIVEILERDYKIYEDKPWKQSGKTIRKAYMTDLVQALIESNEEIKAEKFNNGWIEFDTNEDYEKAIEWSNSNKINRFLKNI